MPVPPIETGQKRRRRPLPPVPSFLSDDTLLTAREGAALARIGVSTWWLRVKEGRIPAPSYALGPKSACWRLSELRAALGGAA